MSLPISSNCLLKIEANSYPRRQQTVFNNRVHWAKSYLSKAQLVEITRRGYFRITERGQKVLQSSPKKIDNKFLMQFEEFRHFRERSSATPDTRVTSCDPAGRCGLLLMNNAREFKRNWAEAQLTGRPMPYLTSIVSARP